MKARVIFAVFLLSMSLCMHANGQTVRLSDKSDWWSMNNEKFPALKLTPRKDDLDSRNFSIGGISLGKLDFERISAKFGKAKVVERGDASSGREQVCYISNESSEKIYLIFEASEGEEGAFYLFTDGTDWKGSGFCAKSVEVTEKLGADSGLRLGLTRLQLAAIIGEPDLVVGVRRGYRREVERRATPEQFERSRREYPDKLSDKLAHQKFDFFTVDMTIEARFTGSKVSYLAVSTTATD